MFLKNLIVRLFIVSIFFMLVACGENNNSAPVEPTIVLSDIVTKARWPAAQREDGTDGMALGYRVYCSDQPNYQPVEGIDVGNNTDYPLVQLIFSDGLWYCSVAPYDSFMEYARQGESSVKRLQGVFYLSS